MIGFDPLYLMLVGPALLFGIWAQFRVKRTFATYSKVKSLRNLTGHDVAQRILASSGLGNVAVEETRGFLSDHYDPRSRTLRLSSEVYRSNSIAAIGIAAHETGHAIQHAQHYGPMGIRQTIAPLAAVGSNLFLLLIIAGMILNITGLTWLGIIAFSIAVVFQIVTLPVEFDASRRALALVTERGMVSAEETIGISKVLSAAGLTYVAATVAAVSQLLYYVLMASSRRD